jgi:hypothetical protein
MVVQEAAEGPLELACIRVAGRRALCDCPNLQRLKDEFGFGVKNAAAGEELIQREVAEVVCPLVGHLGRSLIDRTVNVLTITKESALGRQSDFTGGVPQGPIISVRDASVR